VSTDDKYWFPAKTYGWGWGLPCRWQGWLVMAVFVALLAARPLLLPHGKPLWTIAYITLISGALIGICWLKGEPPRSRWGGED
jgi:hypothetical protein